MRQIACAIIILIQLLCRFLGSLSHDVLVELLVRSTNGGIAGRELAKFVALHSIVLLFGEDLAELHGVERVNGFSIFACHHKFLSGDPVHEVKHQNCQDIRKNRSDNTSE